jgi:hypothetical protein
MEGWIKIHRKLITWEWYNDSKMVHLFLHLLLSANHSDGNWQGVSVKRGQLITGRIKLSAVTGISEQSIRTCLSKLESTKELTIKTTNKNSIITLLNYDSYQIKESANQQLTSKLTNNQPTTNQQLTTNKNDNNKKNEDKTKGFAPPTLLEVKEYFKEKGYTESSAIKAFNYYEEGNWKDSRGQKVKSWKQKMQGVWFKDENKIRANGKIKVNMFQS